MLSTTKHQQGIELYHRGRYNEAVRLFSEALQEQATSELWNDWATANLALSNVADAESGFRRALNCDPENVQAAANLGAVLAKSGQLDAAIGVFEALLHGGNLDSRLRLAVEQQLAQCRAEKTRAEVKKINWWHSIDLGNGIVTPGAYDTRTLLDRIALPADLRGLTVLDIGAWDGYMSFEAERRGASRVLATDSFVWRNNVRAGKKGFELARAALHSKVEDMDIDVMDLSPERVGTFDVVLFLGVLYHLRHPLLALERVRSVTKQLLIMETHVDLPQIQRPAMAFYPGNELSNDPTNWCGPNEACCIAMLKDVGFRNIRVVGRLAPVPGASLEQIVSGRTTFHAEI